jgi:hypothetical protein
VVHYRQRAAVPEKHGNDTERLAINFDSIGSKFCTKRLGNSRHKKPLMKTSHANALTNLGFV